MNNELQFLTSKDVMNILKISRATLSRFIAQGKIPYSKIGGKNRFPRSYFVQMVEEAVNGF